MDFTFDLSQTPVIGKSWIIRQVGEDRSMTSPRRSLSLSPADSSAIAGWKRPWMSQVIFPRLQKRTISLSFLYHSFFIALFFPGTSQGVSCESVNDLRTASRTS